jgi:hypothetical protein
LKSSVAKTIKSILIKIELLVAGHMLWWPPSDQP